VRGRPSRLGGGTGGSFRSIVSQDVEECAIYRRRHESIKGPFFLKIVNGDIASNFRDVAEISHMVRVRFPLGTTRLIATKGDRGVRKTVKGRKPDICK